MTANKLSPDPLYRAQSEEEFFAIRAELREHDRNLQATEYSNGKEGQKLFAQHHHAMRLGALNVAADHGKAFIRNAVLLNGGAIVALLTLLGGLYSKTDAIPRAFLHAFTAKLQLGMHFFLAGLICGAALAGIAYLQWFAFKETHFNEGQTSNGVSHNNLFGPEDPNKVIRAFARWDATSIGLAALSMLFGMASLACFGAGALKVAKAFAFLVVLRGA